MDREVSMPIFGLHHLFKPLEIGTLRHLYWDSETGQILLVTAAFLRGQVCLPRKALWGPFVQPERDQGVEFFVNDPAGLAGDLVEFFVSSAGLPGVEFLLPQGGATVPAATLPERILSCGPFWPVDGVGSTSGSKIPAEAGGLPTRERNLLWVRSLARLRQVSKLGVAVVGK